MMVNNGLSINNDVLVGGLEPWIFMTFHSVGNGISSSQLTFTPSFSEGLKPDDVGTCVTLW